MELFARLGSELDDAWRAVGRDEERFADVAARALEAHSLVESFEREALLDSLLEPRGTEVTQLAPLGAFGQPGTTVHHGEGFAIEVYYWVASRAAIHNHPFCGAFTVLEGWSVHARYAVEERERVGRARLVDAELDELRTVRPGEVHRFSLHSYPLVHALIHVPVPSISLVVRTVRTEGYLRYLPPTLALPMEPVSDPVARRHALLESLGTAGDPRWRERMGRELARSDFESAVHLLAGGWGAWEPEERDELRELVRPRFGARVEAIVPALDRTVRSAEASAIRERLRDPELRLVATALAYADTRARALGLLSEHGDALALLHRFVDGAGLFAPEEAASAAIARSLIDGEDRAATLRRLTDEYGVDAVREHGAEIERYRETSIFSVLAG